MSYNAVVLAFPDLGRTLAAADLASGTAIFELTANPESVGQTKIWTAVTLLTDFGLVPPPDDYVTPVQVEDALDQALERTLGLKLLMNGLLDGTLADAMQGFEEILDDILASR